MTRNRPDRLLIISHVRHYGHDGQLFAYGPYAREIDIWADLFPEVVIAAPYLEGPPPGDWLPLGRRNIRVSPLLDTGGDTFGLKLKQILQLPVLVTQIVRAILAADAVHVRCPGNVGLLGVMLAPLFRRPRVAKYAGQWNGYPHEPWTIALQRRLLRSWWRAPVTVYGAWPDQPKHVIPFFTSMMTEEQVRTAVSVAEGKELGSPLRVLFTGRLVAAKRVDALVEAAALAMAQGVKMELAILGDGPDRHELESSVRRLGLADRATFLGALPFDEALGWYDWAHCLVLPSVHSEGWPKVVAEAMCHGVICIAVRHGQVPAMLEGRGVLLGTGSPAEIAGALANIAHDPVAFAPMIGEGSRWARQHSLEGLRSALAALLSQQWKTGISVVEAHQ